MAKTGRPSKFNEALALRMLEMAKKGATDQQMADAIGVDVSTLGNWKAGRKDFLEALKGAKDVADQIVEATLFQRACGYRHKAVKFFCSEGTILTQEYEEVYAPDTVACIFWLKNRKPEDWRDKQDIDLNVSTPFILKKRNGEEIVMGVETKEPEK